LIPLLLFYSDKNIVISNRLQFINLWERRGKGRNLGLFDFCAFVALITYLRGRGLYVIADPQ
jgi:hypothetical protein